MRRRPILIVVEFPSADKSGRLYPTGYPVATTFRDLRWGEYLLYKLHCWFARQRRVQWKTGWSDIRCSAGIRISEELYAKLLSQQRTSCGCSNAEDTVYDMELVPPTDYTASGELTV